MIAKVEIVLPYCFSVPVQENFNIYQYQWEDYSISFHPPKKSTESDRKTAARDITMNGKAAFNADVLCITFQKNNFARQEGGDIDPSVILLENVANEFLGRLRYVTNASQIRLINLSKCSWELVYKNDDGTDLPKEPGLVHGHGRVPFSVSVIGVTADVWDSVHELEPFKPLPSWKNLLLDAKAMLPEVGPALILAFTALEVFISQILDQMAVHINLDVNLWKWINNRGSLKEPSIEENYDALCRILIGRSLKENNDLWEAFKHLRKARNSFTHEGLAVVGGTEVSDEVAAKLIGRAGEIIEFIKNELPDELKWGEFKHNFKLGFSFPILDTGAKES